MAVKEAWLPASQPAGGEEEEAEAATGSEKGPQPSSQVRGHVGLAVAGGLFAAKEHGGPLEGPMQNKALKKCRGCGSVGRGREGARLPPGLWTKLPLGPPCVWNPRWASQA